MRLRRPHIWGGDFNMSPSQVASSGILQIIRGRIVATSEWTCRQGTSESVIDFFITPDELAALKVDIFPDAMARMAPHRPPVLRLRRLTEQVELKVLDKPRAFPTSKPVGPCWPAAVDWDAATDRLTQERDAEIAKVWRVNTFSSYRVHKC